MKKLFIAIFLLASSINGYAGDYYLTIADNLDSACALKSKKYKDDRIHPVRTTQEIVEDLEKYFAGEKPKLELFSVIFVNARIKFCTPQSRERVLLAIIDALVMPDPVHEWEAYDYLYMLGTFTIVNEIDNRLSKEQSPAVKKRLSRARKSVERGLKKRKGM